MSSKNMNRRDFLSKASIGLAVSGLGFSALKGDQKEKAEKQKFVYRTLGKTGLKLPVVSMGVMNADNPHLVKKALEVGIRHLDTAHVYQRGNNEKMIGEVLQETGMREQVVIGTKMRFAQDRESGEFRLDDDGRGPGASEENLMSQLETSLERLQTDYVDILYIHSCSTPEMVKTEPLLNALMKAKKMGKTRFAGVSTHSNEPSVIRALADTDVYDVVLTTYNFTQDHRNEIKKAIKYATDKGVGVIAMKTQGGRRLQHDGSIEVNHQAALKWVLNDNNVCTAIPGMTTFDQLDLDMTVMNDLTLSKQEKRDLQLSSMLPGKLYCQQCRQCISTCSKRVEVPDLMRAYMYYKGYENVTQARDTLAELANDQGLEACRHCSVCTAQCVRGIQIGERVQALQQMV